MSAPDERPTPGAGADARFDELSRKIDTVAGAMAAVAATQTDLLAQGQEILRALAESTEARRAELAATVEALTAAAESMERSATRTDDRLAGIRDAVAVPLADLQALLTARTERTDAQLAAMLDRIGSAVGDRTEAVDHRLGAGDARGASDPVGDPPAVIEAIERLEGAVAALAERPGSDERSEPAPADEAGVGANLDELRSAVRSLSWQLPELVEEVGALRTQVSQLDLRGPVEDTAEELAAELRHHTDVALAGTIRVLDERFQGLHGALVPVSAPPPQPQGGMGFEAGAVMGSVQAAWSRLEQRLDQEFDQLGHQLVEMDRRIAQAIDAAEAAANRPVVTGEQLRKTASSVKEAVQSAREQRRLRRGGPPPRGLGPG